MESSYSSTSYESNNEPGPRKCIDCKKSYKSCDCKNCSKCGTLFHKFWGTNLVKGRSHCRTCSAAVCVTCHVVVNNAMKVFCFFINHYCTVTVCRFGGFNCCYFCVFYNLQKQFLQNLISTKKYSKQNYKVYNTNITVFLHLFMLFHLSKQFN